MILVDTGVVAEFLRRDLDPALVTWAETIGPAELHLSTVTVQEVDTAIRRLPSGTARDRLRNTWDELLADFEMSLVPYGRDAAEQAAALLDRAAAAGHKLSVSAAQIAGTCLAQGAALATLKPTDFEPVAGLTIIDPRGVR